MSGPVALVEVVRSGFVEGRHTGSVVTLAADGTVAYAAGVPELPVYPRSSNKPLQAVGLLTAGLAVTDEQLALATASHSGEDVHVAVVRALLAAAGLAEADLQCPADLPLGVDAAHAVLRAGGGPVPVRMNCSGKHAAMLATCVAAGWSTVDYLDAGHPLQVALRTSVGELADEAVTHVGVDGCGAPVFAVTLLGLARAFGRLASAATGTPERRVADAMRAHPHLVGGTGRDVTSLMAGVPGLVAKDGAEGVYAAALDTGAAVALKIDDGAARARMPVLVTELRRLGVSAAALDELAELPLLGGGRPVGAVRACYA